MIRDHFNELSVTFESGKQVTFRVFNDGLAYRFSTDLNKTLVVTGELAEFNLAGQPQVYFAKEEGFYSHNERSYTLSSASEISDAQLGSLPCLVKTDAGNILLTETALRDYAGM